MVTAPQQQMTVSQALEACEKLRTSINLKEWEQVRSHMLPTGATWKDLKDARDSIMTKQLSQGTFKRCFQMHLYGC